MDSVKRTRPVARAVGLAALAVGLGPAALAQQAPPLPSPVPVAPKADAAAEGVQTFDGVFFKQYNPVTAADIVNRVPGFEIDDGEVLRGFGATAGNVLVNGERPSSKVLISEQLKRIPADSVVKIELISGSSSNVDVRGQTQLVNVVLKKAKQGGSPVTWVLDVRDIQYSERVGWGVQLTKTFALGQDAELTVDLQAPNLRGRTDSFEAVRNAAGNFYYNSRTALQFPLHGVAVIGPMVLPHGMLLRLTNTCHGTPATSHARSNACAVTAEVA